MLKTNFAKQTIKSMKKVILFEPAFRSLIFKLIKEQKEPTKIRETLREMGIQIPSLLIFSVTDRCNFSCRGCYHKAQRKTSQEELSTGQMTKIIKEAEDLGISVMLLAGGEPFLRKDLLDITERFSKIIFFIFTNGSIISDLEIERLKKQPNVILIFSLEGGKNITDERRGEGAYEKVMGKIKIAKNNKLIFGVSATITCRNIIETASEKFVEELIKLGSKVFFFSEYIPIKNNTDELVLKRHQRISLNQKMTNFRKKYPAVFFTTSDEDEFGGCLAAGRGFVHINSRGGLEPCPMAPFSDSNLKETPLKEALQSKFFKRLREEPGALLETESGCSLWDKREWVSAILESEK